jgi:hypothetical protein
MDVDHRAAGIIWRQAAEALGWRQSPAHAGWISDAHVDLSRYGEGGHPSDMDAQDACFLDGVETLEQAVRIVRKAA